MNDDAELLTRYADESSEAAFRELVRRHVDLVYSAALRRTGGDAHRAADVSQQVFTTLARDARKLSRHTVLAAWLHTTTRNAALNLMISEQRRQARESEALELNAAVAGESNPEWENLRPLLDEAIDELPEADRAAVVLRFLERRAFADIGAALKVSEDAARMRTERALDKLRASLARRGVTSTSAALGALLPVEALISAPTGMASSLASTSLAAVSGGAVAFLTSLMTTKIIITAALSALIAFGAGNYVARQRAAVVTEAAVVQASDQSKVIASMRRQNEKLSAELNRLSTDVARLNDANARLTAKRAEPAPAAKNPTLGLARWEVQRTILNSLRQIDAARHQYVLDHKHAPDAVNVLVGRRSYIKAVRTVSGEDYTGLSMVDGAPLTVTTPDGVIVTYDPSGTMTTQVDVPADVARVEELGKKVQPAIRKAVTAYQAAHNGAAPPNQDALLPFFSTPQEGADFAEFVEAQKAVGP